MVNLRSAHVSVIEKDTGRSVICDVSDFPYTLIWSAPKKPLHFICIEPWHSLPGEENGPIDWERWSFWLFTACGCLTRRVLTGS